MKKTSSARRKTMVNARPQTPNKKDTNKSSSSMDRLVASGSQRKASTPTHDKPTRSESPDVSRIAPTEFSCTDGQVTAGKPVSAPASKTVTGSDKGISLEDQLDFAYTRYLQTSFRRKLAEAEAIEVDDKLTAVQKRIAENQNILQKTIERLKNIKFNKEVEALHKLRNPNYGRVLETLDNAKCKEYLEAMNTKLEQSQNQLKLKNIELPEGGGAELLQITKDMLAACEKLKENNNLEVPKIVAEIKESNDTTTATLSRSLEMVPEVENLILDRAALEICNKDNE